MTPASPLPVAENLLHRNSLPRTKGYHVRCKVGEGRMAVAYLAKDILSGRDVVLKVLRREHAASEERTASFVREFAVPAGIRNSHIIRVHDQIIGERHASIVMEYLPGGDLGRLIRKGLTAAAALSLLRQAAVALQALHHHGFAHGDVKPSNLLLRSSGELVLADFGLARRLDAPQTSTPEGTVVGTPRYAAPEQSQGGPVGAAGDIYSLGIVFHEMLSGKPPFPGDTAMEVFCQHVMAPVPRLEAGLARFQPLVDAMLDKQVKSRLQDGQAVLEQIDLIQDAAPLRPAPFGAIGSRCLS